MNSKLNEHAAIGNGREILGLEKVTYRKERTDDSNQELRDGGRYPIKTYPEVLSSVLYVLCLLEFTTSTR